MIDKETFDALGVAVDLTAPSADAGEVFAVIVLELIVSAAP
jgi:hypothetical protein